MLTRLARIITDGHRLVILYGDPVAHTGVGQFLPDMTFPCTFSGEKLRTLPWNIPQNPQTFPQIIYPRTIVMSPVHFSREKYPLPHTISQMSADRHSRCTACYVCNLLFGLHGSQQCRARLDNKREVFYAVVMS